MNNHFATAEVPRARDLVRYLQDFETGSYSLPDEISPHPLSFHLRLRLSKYFIIWVCTEGSIMWEVQQ